MVIYDKSGSILYDLEVSNDSYRYRKIMVEDSLTLYFSLNEFIEIPLNSWCEFQGTKYYLFYPENFKKHGTRKYEYTLCLETSTAYLRKIIIRNTVDRRLKFHYTATPREHVQLIINNLNERDSGWSIGECIEAVEKYYGYNHTHADQALSDLANLYETEFEITDKTIHLRKIEYNKDNPLVLAYGKRKGLKPGLGRENYDKSFPVEVLYVQGGDRNIDFSKYGHSELLLPKNQVLEYEGRKYISSEDGFSIQRYDKEIIHNNERSLDLSDIYPKWVGEITKVDVVDAEKNFYDIYDSTIPGSLNFTDYLIEGYTMTIIFQDKMLVGREFDVKYNHEERKFEITPTEHDGMVMPNITYAPVVGGKYAVFGISLPDTYVCDNQTQTGASWDMFREAVRFFYENEEQNHSFLAELDGIMTKQDWLEIGGKIKPGGYSLVSDDTFLPNGELIRIIAIKDYVTNPESPEIELSNLPISHGITSELNKIEENEVVEEGRHNEMLSLTRRRWRDTIEMGKMLEKAIDGFSAAINPITISTMQLVVGTEQLQFRFVNSRTNPIEFIPDFAMNDATKVFTVTYRYSTAFLQHMSLGINMMSNSHAVNEYKFWQMSNYTSPYLGDDSTAYYLYAKCPKSGSAGSYLLSSNPITMDNSDGNYYFLVGVLGSEWEGERSFEACYGFTEILPGRITVNLIKSANANTYFNLLEGEIGGNIRILSGSGYNNLSDKPDLGIYATWSQLEVVEGRISAEVGALSKTLNGIIEEKAGWITTAQGNELWASIILENGDEIISRINQTPEEVTIDADKISLNGHVTANGNVEFTKDGKIIAISGFIGGMNIQNNAIDWERKYTYLGIDYYSYMRMGIPDMSSNTKSYGAMFYAAFTYGDPGINTRYGFRAACVGLGSAALYGSSRTSGNRNPGGYSNFAGYFDGPVLMRDHNQSESDAYAETNCFGIAANVFSARTYRWISSNPPFSSSNDQMSFMNGISFNQDIDLDRVRLIVRRGIIVGLTRDNGNPVYGSFENGFHNLGWRDNE